MLCVRAECAPGAGLGTSLPPEESGSEEGLEVGPELKRPSSVPTEQTLGLSPHPHQVLPSLRSRSLYFASQALRGQGQKGGCQGGCWYSKMGSGGPAVISPVTLGKPSLLSGPILLHQQNKGAGSDHIYPC